VFRTADRVRQRHILTQVARLVDAGIVITIEVNGLGSAVAGTAARNLSHVPSTARLINSL
jgi:hypothetical protein